MRNDKNRNEDLVEKNEKIQEINKKIVSAVKSHDNLRAKVYKFIKAAYVDAMHKNGFIMDDALSIKILLQMVSQREDSIEQYTEGNRPDLATNEKEELDIINEILPKLPSNDEIKAYTKEVIITYKEEKSDNYVISMKDMKPVMTKVHAKYPTANGGIIKDVMMTFIKK